MQQIIIREKHYLTHDDYPEVAIPMTVDIRYSLLDDGFPLIEILPETLDYPTWGSC